MQRRQHPEKALALRVGPQSDDWPTKPLAWAASLGWSGAIAPGWAMDATLRLVAAQDRVATQFSNGTENATADLGVVYQWSRQSLRVGLKNLADKAYFEHLTEGVSGRENLAPGRSLVLAWTGRF